MVQVFVLGIILSGMILVSYWIWFFICFKRIKIHSLPISYEEVPVSVIVCYKNAGQSIVNTIHSILSQKYHRFELIAIDDFSTDEVFDSLLQIHDPRLKLARAQIDLPGKKWALTQGIQMANFDWILVTDADAVIQSRHWISSMVQYAQLNTKTDMVLGYGPMMQGPSWISDFARYETFLTCFQYMSYAISGLAYMGVGRNMMYKKACFDLVQGFESHHHIVSGDDDLLVQMVATGENIQVNIDSNSFVYSKAKSTLAAFLHQKSRHFSTSWHYKSVHKLLLGLFAFAQVLFYTLAILAFIFIPQSAAAIFFIVIGKWVIQFFLQHQALHRLQEVDLKWKFPLLDVAMYFYYLVLPIYQIFRRNSW